MSTPDRDWIQTFLPFPERPNASPLAVEYWAQQRAAIERQHRRTLRARRSARERIAALLRSRGFSRETGTVGLHIHVTIRFA